MLASYLDSITSLIMVNFNVPRHKDIHCTNNEIIIIIIIILFAQ